MKKEPVIFYKYTGKNANMSYNDFICKTVPFSEYDEAKNYRDKEIKNDI